MRQGQADDDAFARAIFVRLATCQILLGQFPRPHLLAEFGVTDPFLPLIAAIKAGDRAAYHSCFVRWSEWYRRRGIWLVLREKGEVLLWRNLFRNTWVLGGRPSRNWMCDSA